VSILEVSWYQLKNIMSGVPLFVFGFLFLYIGKKFYDLTTSYSLPHEILENDNPAFGLNFFGYMFGLAVAIFGSMSDLTGHLGEDLLNMAIGGVLAILLVRLSIIINDKCILYKFKIEKEMLEDRNLGTGAVLFGSSVGTGLILSGALSGSSTSVVQGIIDVLLYFSVGQLFLIIGGLAFQKITDYDVHETLEKDDNFAAGISFGAYLLSVGIVMHAVLSGTHYSRGAEVAAISVFAVVSLVLLSASRIISEKIFLPEADLADEIARQKNTAAAMVVSSSFLSIALLLSGIIH